MLSRIVVFVVWALVAAAAVLWGSRIFVRSPAAPANLIVVAAQPPLQADWARLFGADAMPAPVAAAEEPAADARFQLVGVVAPRGGGGGGVALIGVDGKLPRAYKTGAAIDGALVVQGVRSREVTLGPAGGAAQVRLTLPPLPVAATGALPAAGAMIGVTGGFVPPASNVGPAPPFGASIAPPAGFGGIAPRPGGAARMAAQPPWPAAVAQPGLPAPFAAPPRPAPVMEPERAEPDPTTPEPGNTKPLRRRVTTM